MGLLCGIYSWPWHSWVGAFGLHSNLSPNLVSDVCFLFPCLLVSLWEYSVHEQCRLQSDVFSGSFTVQWLFCALSQWHIDTHRHVRTWLITVGLKGATIVILCSIAKRKHTVLRICNHMWWWLHQTVMHYLSCQQQRKNIFIFLHFFIHIINRLTSFHSQRAGGGRQEDRDTRWKENGTVQIEGVGRKRKRYCILNVNY